MSVRLTRPGAGTDRAVLAVVVVTVAVTAFGMLWLARAAVGERPGYRTVRVDNRAGLSVEVDAVDGGGARMGLGEVGPRATATFHEVADLGATWTFVAAYGGREVWRETVTGRELDSRDGTVQVPATATGDLERQGYR